MPSQRSLLARLPFGLFLTVVVLFAVGLQATIYLMVIENTIGPFRLFRKSKPAQPAMARELRVGILRSDASARINPAHPDYYFDLERRWERLLQEARVPFRIISDKDLNENLGRNYPVVVLPWTICLGDNERKAVSQAVAQGMGLVASGALGSRDGGCNWRGWDYLTQLTGLTSPFTVNVSAPVNASFRGQRYFSSVLPAGLNLEMSMQEFVTGRTEYPDIFWSDWKLRPTQGSSPSDVTLGVHTNRGAGRVVWFGFTEYLPKARVSDLHFLDNYLVSSVRWAGRQAMAVVGDWPGRNRAAVLMAEEVVDPDGAVPSSDLLQQEKVPVTFFCSSTARSRPALLRKFESIGELASSGDSRDPFGEQQAAMQTERLVRAKRDLEAGAQTVKILGFSPPEGSSNSETAASVQNAGYRYFFDNSEVRSAVPEIIQTGGGSTLLPSRKDELARIYRTAADDFEIIANYRGPTPWGEDLADGFLQEFHRVAYLGGVYPLMFRSDLLGAPQNLHVLRRLVQKIKAEPVWLAKGQDLVEWWSRREKLRVDVRKISTHRIRVAITNRGQMDVDDASVYVYLPYRPAKLAVSSAVLRLRLPHVELTGEDDVLRLDLPRMRRQSSQILVIALDE